MPTNDYQYYLDLSRKDGTVLGEAPVDPDWSPACASVSLAGMRAGQLPLALQGHDVGIVEPVWDPSRGEPFIVGFLVRMDGNGHGPVTEQFPLTYFSGVARRASSPFVKSGLLKAGEFFNYGARAVPRSQAPQRRRSAFEVEELIVPLPVIETRTDHFSRAAVDHGPQNTEDMAVFVPRSLMDECAAIARAAGDIETGGVLIGNIHRDPVASDLFIEVTDQVTAALAVAALTQLTFTADTWRAVNESIAARRSAELTLGWWHWHPGAMFKKNEETNEQAQAVPQAAPQTSVSTVFLSLADQTLTATCFPAAHSLALVVGEGTDGEQAWGLYGWSSGRLVERGFKIIP